MKEFFSYNSQNLNGSEWKLDYKWGATVHIHVQKLGKTAATILPEGAEYVLCRTNNMAL